MVVLYVYKGSKPEDSRTRRSFYLVLTVSYTVHERKYGVVTSSNKGTTLLYVDCS